MADFETIVYDDTKNQTSTDVWAWALYNLNDELSQDNVKIGNALETFMNYIDTIGKAIIFFHNLKFDGSFILHYLCRNVKYAEFLRGGKHDTDKFNKFSKPGDYTYLISDMGVWYEIKIHTSTGYVIFRDSFKLIPLSVANMGKAFSTKHQKLNIEYKGERVPHGIITDEEKAYIANDVLVVGESIQVMRSQGHNKTTIGACCLSQYKDIWGDKQTWKIYFPNLLDIECPVNNYDNWDAYIRGSYHGGYCYVHKAGLAYNGCTADVNSLYPSVMHSDSHNVYPVGKPIYFTGKPDFEKLNTKRKDGENRYYYFIRLKCRFELKKGYLPTVQIKRNPCYPSRVWLHTSDYIDKNGLSHKEMIDKNGNVIECRPEMILTMTDYELLMTHYNVTDIEYIDGCYFSAYSGIFDDYINIYKKIKMESKGGLRTIAKLFLTNLYGKFATSPDSSYQLLYLDDEGYFNTDIIHEQNIKPVFIPVGTAVTAYARYFTIKAAQANYDHFCYADTDSLHCDCNTIDLVNIPIHDTDFLHWKIENVWDRAIFVRQKTYIEHNIQSDGEDCEPYYSVKCAGMGKNAKAKVVEMLENGSMELTDFKKGFCVSGNLKARRVIGGTLLVESDFRMN